MSSHKKNHIYKNTLRKNIISNGLSIMKTKGEST